MGGSCCRILTSCVPLKGGGPKLLKHRYHVEQYFQNFITDTVRSYAEPHFNSEFINSVIVRLKVIDDYWVGGIWSLPSLWI